MNPQEKAKELIEKFKEAGNMKILLSDGGFVGKELAKQCALICVEEIISVMDSDSFYAVNINEEEKFVPVDEYWQSVKEAIKQIK